MPEVSPGENNDRSGISDARSASYPPEYPPRRDEEQTGVEIATRVLGRNNKTGQAPFYTGLSEIYTLFDRTGLTHF